MESATILLDQKAPLTAIHLRSLDLEASDITSLANSISITNEQEKQVLKSISLSYNQRVGNTGIIALLKHLPLSIGELGFVQCGITDVGGKAILDWMQNATYLRMICMEGNNFSDDMKVAFCHYSNSHPNITIIYQ